MKMKLVICFAGQMGSGKSSVSSSLSKSLLWPRVSFGDYVRAELTRRGGNVSSREELQHLGQTLVDETPDIFCKNVLSQADFKPGDNLLVDGIRHIKIQKLLEEIVQPSDAKLIYLAAENEECIRRAVLRGDKADLRRASTHKVESDVLGELPSIAHAIVNAALSLQQVVESCLVEMQSFGLSSDQVLEARVRLKSQFMD